jgi:mannose-6-phosphate isomerase-like protein (cupin superfamily)
MERKGIFLPPGGGRSYPMGRISSRFWPTAQRPTRSIRSRNGGSRRTRSGPGAHSHDEDDVFYVLEGTMSILLGDRWVDAPRGSFVLVPGGVTHDFENRGATRAGVLNVSVPGDFESEMPGIAQWFAEHPPENAT